MKIEQLQYLIEVAHTGSISAAARELYISQTTLSAVIKSTEEELGFPLFTRTHSGVCLTPEGEEALSIMEEIQGCYEEIKGLRDQAVFHYHPVLIITSPTVQSVLALPLNQLIEQTAPECSLEFKVVTGVEVGNLLLKNEGKIGVTYLSKKSIANFKMIASKYNVRLEILFQDRFYLLVRNDHPLAAFDSISKQDLSNMELAMLEHYHSNSSSFNFRELGPKNRYTTFSSIALIKHAIITRNAAGILTGCSIRYNRSADSARMKSILLTGLDHPNEISLCLIHHASSALNPQETVVLNSIREYFKSLPALPLSDESTAES